MTFKRGLEMLIEPFASERGVHCSRNTANVAARSSFDVKTELGSLRRGTDRESLGSRGVCGDVGGIAGPETVERLEPGSDS